jgi:hypothetical protein
MLLEIHVPNLHDKEDIYIPAGGQTPQVKQNIHTAVVAADGQILIRFI